MAHNEKPIVSSKYLLKKFPGKGGWTYAEIPEVLQNPKNPFGWVKVRGSIDDFELKQYKLMPTGNGRLFLPVKAAIRKKIKKEEGDFVHVTLYSDESKLETPKEIIECFSFEPKKTYETYLNLSEGDQKAYLDWIYSAKKEETKANRIMEMMNKLQRGIRFRD
ncbi:MAG: YdeI/OmpD-associated family protein [Bacteroidia bacterium]